MKINKQKVKNYSKDLSIAIVLVLVSWGVVFRIYAIPAIGEYTGLAHIPTESIKIKPISPVQAKVDKVYAYNERVPQEVIEAEIRRQAREFGLGEQKMVDLAICESGLNNLAKNKKSTALGVYQYLIKTWEETTSFINHKIARTDYKANIREAMIDVSNGETWRWEDCWK